jgi:hypothetical protein
MRQELIKRACDAWFACDVQTYCDLVRTMTQQEMECVRGVIWDGMESGGDEARAD